MAGPDITGILSLNKRIIRNYELIYFKVSNKEFIINELIFEKIH